MRTVFPGTLFPATVSRTNSWTDSPAFAGTVETCGTWWSIVRIRSLPSSAAVWAASCEPSKDIPPSTSTPNMRAPHHIPGRRAEALLVIESPLLGLGTVIEARDTGPRRQQITAGTRGQIRALAHFLCGFNEKRGQT